MHICIVPARGGSSRVKNKNLRKVGDKSLVERAVLTAIRSKIFDKVIVSTDSPIIQDHINKSMGEAICPFLRESAYADDYSTSSAATLHCLEKSEEVFGCSFNLVSQLLPTNPLRTPENLVSVSEFYAENEFDSVVTCAPFVGINPWWSFELATDNRKRDVFADLPSERSQDLSSLYSPSGVMWISSAENIKERQSFLAGDVGYFPIEARYSFDVDTEEDLCLVRALAKGFAL